jgi:hypothetical protein
MSSTDKSANKTEQSINNNYLFYRTPDKYLINIGENHYFIPDNAANNKNWEWLKIFTENVIQDISNRKRNSELDIKKDNKQNGITMEGNRYLKEIDYYINRYIYEKNITISNQNIDTGKTINQVVYEHLNNILTTLYCSKQNINDNIKKLNDAKKEKNKSIDKFMNRRLIINNESKKQNEYSVKIDSEGNEKDDIKILNTLEKLNNELNKFNYNYNDIKNQFTNIDFNNNNYIYSGLDKDIKLYSINIDKNYKDFLIESQKQQAQKQQEFNIQEITNLNDSHTGNLNKTLINLILSIKNRYNIINNNNILNKEINVYDSYISRGVFFYYKNILDELLKKILVKQIDKKNDIFIPISIPIMIYSIIFREIYNNMKDDDVIHFKELNLINNDEMTKFATLFYVEMKPFLDQYKACDSTQKVKIFCNINDNFDEEKFKRLNSMTTNKIREKIPLEPTKQNERVFSIKSSNQSNSDKIDSVNYDILYINQSEENENNANCKPFKLKFNKVFDNTSAQVMAPYMAVSNVINNYEGLILFTFGYSGVGKSYRIFGDEEEPGLLYSIFNSIQNITSVTINIYEIYGMALNNEENFSQNVYQKYIYHKINKDYNNIEESIITNKISNDYGTTINDNLEEFLLKLNNITKNIEKKRGILKDNNVQYSDSEGFKDNEINIKTIKKTKNNPDSSRSILCYELIIDKDGQKIPFIVIDLPGKEIIKDSFGKEGEALLKIKSDVNINDTFLQDNFYNILNKLDKLSEEESAELFKDIKQNKVDGNINVNYKILSDNVASNRSNLGFRIGKLLSDEITININDITIFSKNNDIEINFKDGIKTVTLEELVNNYILNNINRLILKQKHNALAKISNQIILPLPEKKNNSTYNQNNLYLGFKNGSLFNEVSENNYSRIQNYDKFTITLNKLEDLQPYTDHDNLEEDLSIEDESLKTSIDRALNVEKKNLNVSYFIIKEDKLEELKEVYKQNVEESNKKSKRDNLIRAMKNAIKHENTRQNEPSTEIQKPHPILKLTYILDKINDMNYINNYRDNAEKCFKYTKSAEGIFINENINGIMQLMINKKNAGINNMPIINSGYDESKMFYNKPNSISNFNNTLIYDKFYNNYENNDTLRKIDNMYAFFVVANISNNERIKQKLICNATKEENGYKTDLGWDCDEEKLAKEKAEYLEKEKAAIQKANEKRKEDIKFIIDNLGNRDRLEKRDYLLSDKKKTKEPYFEIINEKFKTKFNQKDLEKILKNFKKNNKDLKGDDLKNKFAVELYNKIQIKLAENISTDDREFTNKVIKDLKDEEYSQDIIKNFKEINTNKDGKISKFEFESALKRKLGNKKIEPNALTLIFSSIDTDNSGYITIDEFAKNISKGGGSNDRELYIKEMCKTQVALFRELEDVINNIVAPNS